MMRINWFHWIVNLQEIWCMCWGRQMMSWEALNTKRGKGEGARVPKVQPGKNKKLYKTFFQAIQKELIASSQSVGKGGLIVALAKTAMGGMLGMNIALENIPGNVSDVTNSLYSESQGRIVV